MGKLWTLITQVHSVSGPVLMLLYPLYASVMAIESTSKLDDQQWLAYWILYSFLTLLEMILQPILEWIPIWYDVKLLFVIWLVLPQFQGAAFLYERYVREQISKYRSAASGASDHHQQKCSPNGSKGKASGASDHHQQKSPNGSKGKHKFMQFVTPKKGEQEAY